MKKTFACLSDIHGNLYVSIPQSDYLLISGDIVPYSLQHDNELSNTWFDDVFIPWCERQPVERVIFIAGNHDYFLDKTHIGSPHCSLDSGYTRFFGEKTVYLYCDRYEHDGIVFYGSPWTPWFWNWAFNLPKDDAEVNQQHWEKIPDDVNILLTHGPPANILDVNDRYEHCGCPDLLNRVGQLQGLRLHLFGHIHEGFGSTKINNTLFCNAAVDGILRKGKGLEESPQLEIDLSK